MARLQKLIFYPIFFVCLLIQVLPLIRSGISYNYGIGFWGPNGHDGIWHLSLINNISNPFSIDMPVFSGEKLQNYHPFFDILLHYLDVITPFTSTQWYFQLFPLLSSAVFLFLSFKLGRLLTGSFYGGILLLILNTINNSLGWVISLLRFGNFSGESIFWAMQSPSNQINPPFHLSLIFLLILFYILFSKIKTGSLLPIQSLIVFFILVLLPVTKVYSALVGFSIFGIFAVHSYIRYHKPTNLFLFATSLFFALVLFFLYNPISSGLLVWQPLWIIDSLFNSPDRLYFPFFSRILGGPHRIWLQIFGIIIFLIGNFGWRLLPFITRSFKTDFLRLSLLFNIIVLSLIPLFIIQKSTPWNTVQFIYYALFIGNIFLAEFLTSRLNQSFYRYLTLFIIITNLLALTGSAPNYLGIIPPAALPLSEYQALEFLSLQPAGTVLTVPYDPYLRHRFSATPLPLYAYETSSYVSAYSRQPVFLEDEMNLGNSGYPYNIRKIQSLEFFKQNDLFRDRGFLLNNQISYIYLAGLQQNNLSSIPTDLSLQPIFQNDGATIYRVLR